MRYDLHVHTKYSLKCGISNPKDIIKVAMKKRLDGVAITDHNTIKGGMETKKYENNDIQVIVGCELSTLQGEIIGLFLTEEIMSRDIYEAIDEIHLQGGLVIVPHPFDELRKDRLKNIEDYTNNIDAIEGFNSRCIFDRYNKNAIKFADEHKIPIVAGSDAHFANEIGLAGIYSTYNLYEDIIHNNIKIFGQRSPLMNHVKTKTLKSFRRISNYEN
jgi:predicted metal-dependent phosphoesterase TrpH